MSDSQRVYPLHPNNSLHDAAVNLLGWTWLMTALAGLGLALLLTHHPIDTLLWTGTSHLLGGLAAGIGIPGTIGCLALRRLVLYWEKAICPRCQWGLSELPQWDGLIWLGSQLLRIGSLLTLLITILLGELFLLWFIQYNEALFSGTPLFYAGALSLAGYVFATILYLYLDTEIELHALEHVPPDVLHTHGSVIDQFLESLNRDPV